jgi:hypothetical protein
MSSGFAIPRIPILRYADSWLPQWRFPPYRGFGLRDSEMHKHLVTRIPDIPMTKMPIDDFLSGLSPMTLIAATRPLKMDGSDFSSRFRDF